MITGVLRPQKLNQTQTEIKAFHGLIITKQEHMRDEIKDACTPKLNRTLTQARHFIFHDKRD